MKKPSERSPSSPSSGLHDPDARGAARRRPRCCTHSKERPELSDMRTSAIHWSSSRARAHPVFRFFYLHFMMIHAPSWPTGNASFSKTSYPRIRQAHRAVDTDSVGQQSAPFRPPAPPAARHARAHAVTVARRSERLRGCAAAPSCGAAAATEAPEKSGLALLAPRAPPVAPPRAGARHPAQPSGAHADTAPPPPSPPIATAPLARGYFL